MKTTGSKPAKPQVLVVDDDITIRGLLTETLVDRGYEVCVAPRVEDARAFYQVIHPQVVVLDWRLPDGDGLQLLPEIKRQWPDTEVIMMTGYGTPAIQAQAAQLGAIGFLNKPFLLDELILAVHAACQHRMLVPTNQRSAPAK
jgi:two-component system response regulator AtoC